MQKIYKVIKIAKKKKCSVNRCAHKPRTRGMCHKHYMQWWRKVNPIEASYIQLKSNAKRRGKVFEISLEYFRKFCYRTKYIAGKGRTKDAYSVDRIIEELGYIEGNIQMLPVGANKKKHLNYDWETRTATVVDGRISYGELRRAQGE